MRLAERSGANRSSGPWSEQKIYQPFIRWSLGLTVLIGSSTGAAILLLPLLGQDVGLGMLAHGQAHGFTQLFGWAGLFIMGLAFHVVPRFRNAVPAFPWPQRASLALTVSAVLLRFSGQTLYRFPVSEPFLVLSGALLLAAAATFATVMFQTIRKGSNPYGPIERWLAAGTVWFVIAAALHLAVVVRMVVDGSPLVYYPLNRAFIYASLFGFITSFIFAVSLRAVRGFLGLRPLWSPTERAAYLAVNVGTAILVAFSLFEDLKAAAAVGTIILTIGLVLYIMSIRVFEPGTPKQAGPPGTYPRFTWLIRAAYSWLLVSAVLLAIQAVADITGQVWLRSGIAAPVLHVMTLGFVTGLIMGVGSRMLPIFEGSEVLHPRLFDAALVLLPASLAIRLASSFSDSLQAGRGASGLMSLLAILLFGLAALEAMTEKARRVYRERAAALGRARMAPGQRSGPAMAKVEFMKPSGSRPAPPGSR